MYIIKKLKILAALLITLQIVFMSTLPVFAWKPKTHMLTANLILEELEANNGYLGFPYFGKIKVQDTNLNAIRAYPDYFRAGSIGPDAFPDIYVGQVFAHPKTKLTAGEWIEYLFDQINKMPAQSEEQKKVLAFALGYTVHASGDLFGHSYINNWAGGSWPDIMDEDNISTEDEKLIKKHMAVEEYIDRKIPGKFNAPGYNAISIPKDFIYNHFVTNGKAANYDDPRSDALDISQFYKRTGDIPKHFDMFYKIRNELKSGIASRESYNPVRIYQEYWLKDIDEGLKAWVDTSELVAEALLLPEGGFTKAKDHLTDWATHHFLSMVGFPDVVGGTLGVIGNLADMIEDVIPDFLNDIIKKMKDKLYDVIFNWAFGIKYTEIEAIMRDPSKYLDDTNYFPVGSRGRLQIETTNIANISGYTSVTIPPLKNSITMAKLNLVGEQGMNEILRLENMEHVGSTLYPPICYIESLDVGYDWNDISFEGLNIWDDHRAREAIFDNLFLPESDYYKWLTQNERVILDTYRYITREDPGPDNMRFYAELMKVGWTVSDVRNDILQRISAAKDVSQYIIDTQILEEAIGKDMELNSRVAGKPLIVYKSLNLNGKKLTVNCNMEIDRSGIINLNGGTLIVNGNLTINSGSFITQTLLGGGTLFVNGGTVYVHGNLILIGGIIDAGRGSIYVDRDFEHLAGLMNVNGGKVNVSSTYALANLGSKYINYPVADIDFFYNSSRGILQMKNDNDYVFVGRNFITASSNSHEDYLSAGTLEVKGDFYQASRSDGCRIKGGIADLAIAEAEKHKEDDKLNFKASGSHRVLLSGDRIQNVGMALTSLTESQFSILEINNPTVVKFVTKVTVANLFKHNNKKFTLADEQGSVLPVTETENGSPRTSLVEELTNDPLVNGVIELKLGSPKMKLRGKLLDIDPGKSTAPESMEGRTCLPIRAVAEAMGSTVSWDNNDKKVTLERGDRIVELWMGRKTVRINGKEQDIDVAPYSSKTGRTMIPVRFAAESLGASVTWDNNTKTATIEFKQTPDPIVSTGNAWNGVWITDYGHMELVQKGSSITGVFGEEINPIKGSVTGNVFSGTFTENGLTQDFRFVLDAKGESFTGKYDNNSSTWDGKKDKYAKANELVQTPDLTVPAGGAWNGVWYTDYGRMDLVQKGSYITGVFGEEINPIKGSVTGNVFTGTFTENGLTQDFRFVLEGGGESFTGTYDHDTSTWGGNRNSDY